MKEFIKKNYKKIAIGIMMIAGLSLLMYPLVANTWNNHVQASLVNNYSENVTSAIEEGKLDVDAELSKAVQT